jgi:hypothetical protein
MAKERAKLDFHLSADQKSPAVNPAFVIDGWGRAGAALRVNGRPIGEGKDFRIGHIDRLEGSSLVIWIRAQLISSAEISIIPDEAIRR